MNPNEQNEIDARLALIEKKLGEVAVSRNEFLEMKKFINPEGGVLEIDFLAVWRALWRDKWLVLGVTLGFSIAILIRVIMLPNIYKSEALLVPSSSSSDSGFAAIAGKLGGLASLAGVNLGGGAQDNTTLALEVLKSREFIDNFVRKHELTVALMASKGWDAKSDSLKIDSNIYDEQKNNWIENSRFVSKKQPASFEVYEYFRKRLRVGQDKETGFVTVGFEFFSPKMARKIVDDLIFDINLEIKIRDVEEAKKSILYLTEQMNKTSLAEMKSIFYELIEEQTKTIMFAEVRTQYVFKIVDPAVEPILKYKPKRFVILVFGTMFFGFLSCAFVVIRHLYRESKK